MSSHTRLSQSEQGDHQQLQTWTSSDAALHALHNTHLMLVCAYAAEAAGRAPLACQHLHLGLLLLVRILLVLMSVPAHSTSLKTCRQLCFSAHDDLWSWHKMQSAHSYC